MTESNNHITVTLQQLNATTIQLTIANKTPDPITLILQNQHEQGEIDGQTNSRQPQGWGGTLYQGDLASFYTDQNQPITNLISATGDKLEINGEITLDKAPKQYTELYTITAPIPQKPIRAKILYKTPTATHHTYSNPINLQD